VDVMSPLNAIVYQTPPLILFRPLVVGGALALLEAVALHQSADRLVLSEESLFFFFLNSALVAFPLEPYPYLFAQVERTPRSPLFPFFPLNTFYASSTPPTHLTTGFHFSFFGVLRFRFWWLALEPTVLGLLES